MLKWEISFPFSCSKLYRYIRPIRNIRLDRYFCQRDYDLSITCTCTRVEGDQRSCSTPPSQVKNIAPVLNAKVQCHRTWYGVYIQCQPHSIPAFQVLHLSLAGKGHALLIKSTGHNPPHGNFIGSCEMHAMSSVPSQLKFTSEFPKFPLDVQL